MKWGRSVNAIDVLDLLEPTETYTPTDWQLADIERMSRSSATADWSEMGCFKTTTALWLAERRKVRNVLVVTSKMGKGTYFDAIPKALAGWKTYNVNLKQTTLFKDTLWQPEVNLDELLLTTQMGMHSEPWIFLVHYDCFQDRHEHKYGILKKFSKVYWDMLICDEAHKLKNRKTAWTRNIKRLQSKTRHVMTGTGFVNDPSEIWSILHFLDSREYSSYWKFRTKFCDEAQDARGYRIILGLKKNRVQEFRKIRADLGPRHTMDEVHQGVHHPIESVREVELNAEQKRMYRDIKAVLSTLDQSGERLDSPNVLSQLNRLRQICVATPQVDDSYFSPIVNRKVTEVSLVEPSSKLDEVMAILEELRWDAEVRRQVVIFSNFKDPLKLLEARFEDAGIPYLHMEQRHNEDQRYHMWHDLWPKGNHRVFMSTLALGGESINLTSAKYLIFLDRSWSPKDMMQAIGRVYRPGQVHVPEIIYISAKGTVDSYVKSRLDRKQGWFQEIFGK